MSNDKKSKAGRPKIGSGLNEQQQKFVIAFLKHSIAARAAREAGYDSFVSAAKRLVKNHRVIKAIEEARASAKLETGYDAAECLREADASLKRAIATKNVNAEIKAVDLKGRIMGVIQTKPQETPVGFIVQIGGIEDAIRAGLDTPPAKAIVDIEPIKENDSDKGKTD